MVSKAVGYAIVLGATCVQIPQLLLVYLNPGDAGGLSLHTHLWLQLGYLINARYAIAKEQPFSTYGETLCQLSQNAALIFMILWYAPVERSRRALWCLLAALAFHATLTAMAMAPSLGIEGVERLQFASIFIFAGARVPQVWANYATKSVRGQSALTCGLMLAGNLGRVLTTYVEVSDAVVMAGYLVSLCLTALQLGQIIIFGTKSAPQTASTREPARPPQPQLQPQPHPDSELEPTMGAQPQTIDRDTFAGIVAAVQTVEENRTHGVHTD